MRYLFIFIMLLSFSAFGQSKGVKNATQDACDCLDNVEFSVDNIQEVSAQGQQCIENAVLNNFDRLLKDYDLDPENLSEEDGYIIGTDLTESLMANCEKFVTLTILINEVEQDQSEEEETSEITDEPNAMVGELVGISVADFVYVYVKDDTGTIHEFVWMTPLQNSSNFEQKGEELIGQLLIINWEEIQLYKSDENSYMPYKLLVSAQ